MRGGMLEAGERGPNVALKKQLYLEEKSVRREVITTTAAP